MGKRQRRRLRECSQQVTPSWPAPEPSRGAEVVASGRLQQLVDQRRKIEEQIDDEISRLKRRGVSWPTIAGSLGVTRQAARQRWLRTDGNAVNAARSTSAGRRT